MENEKAKPKRSILPWISALMLLLFSVSFLYSPVSMYLDYRLKQDVRVAYQEAVVKISPEELQAEWDKAVAYNESLLGDPVHDPFVVGSGVALPENYLEVLNQEDGIMGYIEIPKISVYLPIYHGTSEDTLEKGVGHIQESCLPIGGEATHCLLSGHTGLPNAQMFNNLVSLKEGDTFFLHVLDQTLAYRVDQINVVLPTEFGELLNAEDTKDLCTLITCTPYGRNTHRLLVRGERVPYEEEQTVIEHKDEETSSAHSPLSYLLKRSAIVGGIVLLFVIMLLTTKQKDNQKQKGGKT